MNKLDFIYDHLIRKGLVDREAPNLQKAAPAAGIQNPSRLMNPKAFPVGTVHNGRKKIAEGKWVEVSSGKAYSAHDDHDKDHMHWSKYATTHDKKESLRFVEGLHKGMKEGRLKEEHVKDAMDKFDDMMHLKHEAQNLEEHYNTEHKLGKMTSGSSRDASKNVQEKKESAKKVFNEIKSILGNGNGKHK